MDARDNWVPRFRPGDQKGGNMPALHSKFSPSASKRWRNCPGSLLKEDPPREPSSVYAAEGTAAHELGERCVTLGTTPDEYRGEHIEVVDDVTGQQEHGPFVVDDGMCSAVQVFVDTVEAEVLPGAEVETEIRQTHLMNEDLGGTADIVITGPLKDESGTFLTIVDYKHGQGIPVEAYQNDQLLCYATILISNMEVVPKMVRLIIVQPRAIHPDGPVRIWEPSIQTIQKFESEVLEIIDPENDMDRPLKAGDHCRWCPHKIGCPELEEQVIQLSVQPKPDDRMEPERVTELLGMKTAVDSYMKALVAYQREQMGVGVEFSNEDGERLKLVRTFGNRKFSLTEEEMLVKLRSREYGKKDCFVSKLKTPAQLEKLDGMDRKWLAKFCERPETGTTVVPVSDSRPAITPKTAADAFKGIDFNAQIDAIPTGQPAVSDSDSSPELSPLI